MKRLDKGKWLGKILKDEQTSSKNVFQIHFGMYLNTNYKILFEKYLKYKILYEMYLKYNFKILYLYFVF